MKSVAARHGPVDVGVAEHLTTDSQAGVVHLLEGPGVGQPVERLVEEMVAQQPGDDVGRFRRGQVRDSVELDETAARHPLRDRAQGCGRGGTVRVPRDGKDRYGDLREPVADVERRERVANLDVAPVVGVAQRA